MSIIQPTLGTKAFTAKGSNVTRCPTCLLAQDFCICSFRNTCDAQARFCVLTHHIEQYKPTNTGRLIGHVLPETCYFPWFRTEADKGFIQLLAADQFQPYIIFPATNDTLASRVVEYSAVSDKPPLFILLDGTWRQAAKMVRSEWLKDIPLLPLDTQAVSRYKLRKASHEHQLCTVEVAIELLKLAGEENAEKTLDEYFDVFNQQYALSRRRK